MTRRLPLLRWMSVLLFVLRTASLAAAETWIEVKSAHFTVYTPAGEKEARNIANQFEQVRALFHSAFPQLQTDSPQPIVILAVKGEKGMKELLPEEYEVKGHLHVAGLYQEGLDKHYVLLELGAPGDNPYHPLYHEYTHSLMHLNLSHLPLWLDEGLAEYFGNITFGDKQSRIGVVDPSHLYALREHRFLPIETLLAVDHNSPYYNETNRASVFYAESWALMHYLMLDPEARKKQLLPHFLQAWDKTKDPLEAARQTFGDLKKFGGVLEAYIRVGDFFNGLIDNPAPTGNTQLASRPVSTAEVIALRGDFFAHHNRPGAAKPLLEEAEKLDPSLALPHSALARLYFPQQSPQEVMKEAKEAIRLGDTGFFPVYLLAESQWQMGLNGESSRQQVIGQLKKCIERNPLFAPCDDLLAKTYAISPDDQNAAISASLASVKKNPSALQYAAQLTQLLLNNNREADAKFMAERIVKDAYSPQEKEMARELALRVANHKDMVARGVTNLSPTMIAGGSKEVATVTAADSGVTKHNSDRPPGAQQLMLGVEGTVATVDCKKDPAISLTLDGAGGFLPYHVTDSRKISITALDNKPTPACTEWVGRKVKVWFVMTNGNKTLGEVDHLVFQ